MKKLLLFVFCALTLSVNAQKIDVLLDGGAFSMSSPNGIYVAGNMEDAAVYYNTEAKKIVALEGEVQDDGGCFVWAINDKGQLAVDWKMKAAIWTEAGEFELLPEPDRLSKKEKVYSAARCISNDGKYVVVSFGSPTVSIYLYTKGEDGNYTIEKMVLPEMDPIYNQIPQFIAPYGVTNDGNRILARYLVETGEFELPFVMERTPGGDWVTRWIAPEFIVEGGKTDAEFYGVEFEFDNKDFTLELRDCAGGSSQGGKLSFWNCTVTRNDTVFMIGINSDMLLELLKNATFINGKCQSPLIFITQKGKVGMTVEGSDTWQQCIKDKELKDTMKKTQTSKFSFGDRISTATIDEYYLGTITEYYKFDPGRNDDFHYRSKGINFSDCIITKLKKPITYHLFKDSYNVISLKEVLTKQESSIYSYFSTKKTCPKRSITGKINMDCTEEEYKQELFKKIYDYLSTHEDDDKYRFAMVGYQLENTITENGYVWTNAFNGELKI